MLMKAIIVEDEPRVRKGLSEMVDIALRQSRIRNWLCL